MAAAGLLNLMIAGAAMAFSHLFVVTNSPAPAQLPQHFHDHLKPAILRRRQATRPAAASASLAEYLRRPRRHSRQHHVVQDLGYSRALTLQTHVWQHVWHSEGMTDGWARRLLRVKDLMDRAYAEPLGVPALAELVFASADHFSRRFKQSFGETPHQYLLTRRMERAKALLRDSDLSVTEVCHAVGFTSLGSFSTRFFELVGESPSAYRQRWQTTKDRVPAQWIPACVVLSHTRPLPKRSVFEKPPASPYD